MLTPNFAFIRPIVLLGIITAAIPSAAPAQKTKSPKQNSAAASPSSPTKSDDSSATTKASSSATQQQTSKSIQSKLVDDTSSVAQKGDYVPCEFSLYQLLQLRPQPDVYVLTVADEDSYRTQVISEAEDETNDSTFSSSKQRNDFVAAVSNAHLVGLTWSEALARILSILAPYTRDSTDTADLNPRQIKLHNLTQQDDTKPLSEFFNETYGFPIESSTLAQAKTPSAKLDALSAAAKQHESATQVNDKQATKPTASTDQQSKTSETPSATDDLAAIKRHEESSSSKKQFAQAIQGGALNTRPPDIACSMSILSYQTARYAFGQKVAEEYIPVQIIVRNLNPDKEFLVHDAEAAVDMDINGRLGRYSSGVDKLTVRTFMLVGRDYSKRNLTVHIAQGIGILLSSTSLVAGVAVKDAANVYNSGFLTALTGVLPDHSTDQLNLLNDEGFSSYRTERTVVPKSGTAEFVIFIRSNLYEQGWWTQRCAKNITIGANAVSGSQSDDASAKQQAQCLGFGNSAQQTPGLGCSANPQIGVDLNAARRVCLDYFAKLAPGDPARSGFQKISKDPQGSEGSGETSQQTSKGAKPQDNMLGDTPISYFKPTTVHYKDWSPVSQAIFRELTNTVVAGTHISEDSDSNSAISTIDCPKTDQGDIDFDKADGNNIVCTLTGANLENFQALKLKNSDNPSDPATASGNVATTTAGTSKTTKVTFSLDSLGKLDQKSYAVSAVGKDGREAATDKIIYLTDQPYLPATGKPTPPSVNFETLLSATGKPVPIVLKGYHLDQVQQVRFEKASDGGSAAGSVTSVDIAPDSGATALQAQVTLTADNVKGKISGDFSTQNLKLAIFLIPKSSTAPIPTKQTLEGTGKVTSSPAAVSGTQLTAKPTSLTFTSKVKVASAAQTVTLKNPGTSSITSVVAAISDTNSGFISDNSCGGTIEATKSCGVSVKFTPSASGAKSATLTITYVSSGGKPEKLSVPLKGTVTPASSTEAPKMH